MNIHSQNEYEFVYFDLYCAFNNIEYENMIESIIFLVFF